MLTCDILLAIYEARTPTQTPDATRVVCVGGTPNHRGIRASYFQLDLYLTSFENLLLGIWRWWTSKRELVHVKVRRF